MIRKLGITIGYQKIFLEILIDLLVERVEVTIVSSQLNLNIQLRFDQSKITQNESGYEPKKGSPKSKSDDEESWNDMYGGTNSKGYLCISIYHKMRKRRYWNRLTTQFVPLCREEVKRLQDNHEMKQSETRGKLAQDYIKA